MPAESRQKSVQNSEAFSTAISFQSIKSVRKRIFITKRIFISENLTPYRKEMMSLAVEKKRDGKINNVWTIDGKIFIKTSPMGNPRQMYSIEDVKEL